jgi:hypothetical protein
MTDAPPPPTDAQAVADARFIVANFSLLDVSGALLLLITPSNVDDVMAAVPDVYRPRVSELMRELFTRPGKVGLRFSPDAEPISPEAFDAFDAWYARNNAR